MSKVNIIRPNILTLEYRQDKEDKDYGSCIWARFNFNLDRYELFISSDCGTYGYKWCETPKTESFIELMSRVDKDYLLHKLCGEPKEFDYDATKESILRCYEDDEVNLELVKSIFEEIEDQYEPNSADCFALMWDEADSPDHNFPEIWDRIVYSYSYDAIKIVNIFENEIKKALKEILAKGGNV